LRDEKKCTEIGQNTSRKCIIMHVLGWNWEKVHYNALFGDEEKDTKRISPEVSGAETQRR
jgi:hypothetical protein